MQTFDKPTHRCGHIIDWILHRYDDDNIQTTHVSHQLKIRPLHYCMQPGFVFTKPTTTFTCKTKLCSIDNCSSIQDVKQ